MSKSWTVLTSRIAGCALVTVPFTGCTSLADLHPPKEVQHIVLSADYVRAEHRGIAKGLKVVEGLRAGTYRAVREDADGVYFEGNGSDCVLVLVNARAEEYLSTGKVQSYEKRRLAHENYGGGRGGLWLPRQGVGKEPRLFYSINNDNGPVPYHFGQGITFDAIVSATNGALGFVPYGSEKEFVAKLKVQPGNGPDIPCPSSD